MYVPVWLGSIMGSRRLAPTEERLEQRLQILNVGRRALIEDHQIDRELLHPPVLVRAEELPHDADVLGLVDLNQYDREVARNPVSPERVGTTRVTREHVRGGPERPVRIEHATGEALEEVRFVGTDAEVMLLDLRLRPR